LDEEHIWRAAFFWLLFFSCSKKSNWFEGIRVKNRMEAGKRSACLVHKVHALKLLTQQKLPNNSPIPPKSLENSLFTAISQINLVQKAQLIYNLRRLKQSLLLVPCLYIA
jgi:hypothetical protein